MPELVKASITRTRRSVWKFRKWYPFTVLQPFNQEKTLVTYQDITLSYWKLPIIRTRTVNTGCKSTGEPTWCGFQSLSKMTTVSAACRLRPRPPALVLSRKIKYWEPSSLNFFNSVARSSDLVVPETPNVINIEISVKLTLTKSA